MRRSELGRLSLSPNANVSRALHIDDLGPATSPSPPARQSTSPPRLAKEDKTDSPAIREQPRLLPQRSFSNSSLKRQSFFDEKLVGDSVAEVVERLGTQHVVEGYYSLFRAGSLDHEEEALRPELPAAAGRLRDAEECMWDIRAEVEHLENQVKDASRRRKNAELRVTAMRESAYNTDVGFLSWQ